MKLSTAEKFLLLAHHPDKGRFIISDVQTEYGIIGAILLDMSLENLISIEDGKLLLRKSEKADNQIINEVLSLIGNSDKPRKIKYWIPKLARKSRKYKWIVLMELEKKSVMQIESRKILGIIPYRKSYLTDNYSRNNMIQQLRNNILFHKELNNESVSILGMVEACKMQKIIATDRDELKRVREELKQIMKESPIADTVNQTIKQVQAAIIGAMMAAVAASSTAAHH